MFCAAGAVANRWRGFDDGTPLLAKRIVCGMLAAASLLFQPWPDAGFAFLIAAVCTTLGFTVFPHGLGLDGSPLKPWARVAYMSAIGTATMAAPAAIEAFYFDNEVGGAALLVSGLLKGPCYMLPRGAEPNHKFIWRELAWGACFGLGVDVAVWSPSF